MPEGYTVMVFRFDEVIVSVQFPDEGQAAKRADQLRKEYHCEEATVYAAFDHGREYNVLVTRSY